MNLQLWFKVASKCVLATYVLACGSACTNTIGSTIDVTSDQSAPVQNLELARDFSSIGSDGKTHTLASLTEGGKTLVLYFVKNGCGSNPRALPLFNSVSEKFLDSDKVSFMAVFNDNKEAFSELRGAFGLKFRALLDPNHEIIKSYGIRSSQGSLVIKDGKILKKWKGFSKSSLTELGELMADASGTKFDVDLSTAPGSESFG